MTREINGGLKYVKKKPKFSKIFYTPTHVRKKTECNAMLAMKIYYLFEKNFFISVYIRQKPNA